jgi:hypothetical protein
MVLVTLSAPLVASTLAWTVAGVAVALLVALLLSIYVLTVTGRLTLDVGFGRATRALQSRRVHIDAPIETVFDQLAAPYALESPPRALREKVTVLERGSDHVVASHRTRVGPITTVTVESVVLDRPRRIDFRLLRGPVPHAKEHFELREADGGTDVTYVGELGADFGVVGRLWSWSVARQWQRAVDASLAGVTASAEELAARRRRRAATPR